MTDIRFMPPELETVVGAEKIDFCVFGKRNKPAGHSMSIILFGAIWSAITSIFVVVFFGEILAGGEFHFYVNDTPKTASLENMEAMLFPALFIGVFVLIGIVTLLWGFITMFQKGGYFVGTASRLLRYHSGKLYTYDWEQFSGNMEINIRKGNISLQLRTGRMVSRKNGPSQFVSDIVYISGIPNVLEIEKICRQRIKENDPTPANSTIKI